MAASADLVVNIVTKMSGDGMAQAEKSTSKFRSGLATASKVAGAALLGIGAAAIGAANAAAEDAQSQALLAKSMQNAAGASKSQIAATEDWIDAQSRATGVADDELRPALSTLVRATGDVEKSQRALKVAMDVSAATGKPLKSVTDAMAKGYSGNTSALSRLVPGISKAAIESGKFSRVMSEVAKKTKGSAAAAADTAAGKMKRFQNALSETQEAAGAALLPVMDKLAGVLVKVGQWAQDHGTMFTVIAGGVAALAAAVVTLNIAMTIYTAVTTLAGSATLAAWAAALGPILLVIAAVALVVAAVVILWKKSKTFRTVVLAVWSAIKNGAKGLGRFLVAMWNTVAAGAKRMAQVIRAVWNGVRAAGKAVASVVRAIWKAVWQAISLYVRAYLAVIRAVFSAIRSVVSTVVGWIKARWQTLWAGLRTAAQGLRAALAAVWQAIRQAAGAAADWIREKWSGVWSALKSAASGVASVLTRPFNAVKSAIENVISAVENLISALGRIHVPKISLPHIPGLGSLSAPAGAAGAATLGASPAVPQARVGAGASAGAGGTVINIYGAVDPEGTARQVQRLLSGHTRRIGLAVS